MIAAKKWAVKSRRKASVKTVKRKGKNQRKTRKVMAATREPNIQSTERDEKQNMIAAIRNELDLFLSSVLECISIPAEQKCLL